VEVRHHLAGGGADAVSVRAKSFVGESFCLPDECEKSGFFLTRRIEEACDMPEEGILFQTSSSQIRCPAGRAPQRVSVAVRRQRRRGPKHPGDLLRDPDGKRAIRV